MNENFADSVLSDSKLVKIFSQLEKHCAQHIVICLSIYTEKFYELLPRYLLKNLPLLLIYRVIQCFLSK